MAAPRPGQAGGGSLELRDVSVHFGARRGLSAVLRGGPQVAVRAVDGVSLRIEPGEVMALVGESGCGKTTTGRALVRLAPITSGSVVLDGEDVTRIGGSALAAYRRRVQIIFQDPYESINPKQTIEAVVSEPLSIQGIGTRDDRRDRVLRALEDAGLRPAKRYLARFPHELSGGQRQRVAIAAAMALEPSYVVADEPVSMLDVSLRTGILRVMADLRDRKGLGYLFITHDLSLAWLFADRIGVMYLGRLVEEGPTEALVRNPAHPYTRALLSVMPSPNPSSRRKRQILQGETPDASRIPAGCRFHPRCPVALARCAMDDPPVVDLGGGHRASCWLAGTPAGPAEQAATLEG